MSAIAVQNLPTQPVAVQDQWSFTSWCRIETSNLFSQLPGENKCLEVIRRIAILFSVILPLIGLFANCCCAERRIIKAEPLSLPKPLESIPPLQSHISEDLSPSAIEEEEQLNLRSVLLESPKGQSNPSNEILLSSPPSEVRKLTEPGLPDPDLVAIRNQIKEEMPLFYELMYSKMGDDGQRLPLDYHREYLVRVAKELGFETTYSDLHKINFRAVHQKLKAKFRNLNNHISLVIKTENVNRLFGYFVTKSTPDTIFPNQRCLVVIHKNKNDEPLYSFRPGSRDLFQWAIAPEGLKDDRDLVRTEKEFELLTSTIAIHVSSKIPEPPTAEKHELNHRFSNFYHSGAITSWVALLALVLPREG